MKLWIFKGPADEPQKLQAGINARIDEAGKGGYKLNERLTTTHFDGADMVYSLFFEPKKKDPSSRKKTEVLEPSEIEKIIMSCFNAKFITDDEREKIAKYKMSLDEAQQIQLLYEGTQGMERDAKGKMGLKMTFGTFINQLRDQLGIAISYNNKHKPAQAKPKEADIPEPTGDWRAKGEEIFGKGEEHWRNEKWADVQRRVQQEIIDNI